MYSGICNCIHLKMKTPAQCINLVKVPKYSSSLVHKLTYKIDPENQDILIISWSLVVHITQVSL